MQTAKQGVDNMTIAVSYGRVAEVNGRSTGLLYGSGYGQDEDLAAHADHFASYLSARYGLDVEKRGNSDGRSAGAHYDGRYKVALGSWRSKDGSITFDAYFGIRAGDEKRVLSEVSNRWLYPDAETRAYRKRMGLHQPGNVTVYSGHFQSPQEAITWLERWGEKFCPILKPSA